MSRARTAALMALPAFAGLHLAVSLAWQPVPGWVTALYLGGSVAAFAAYALDKSAAAAGRWRVPERSLLLIGLAGGWPGAVLAQQWLRHKTRKRRFQVAFWLSVALNVAGFVALQSPALGRLVTGR